MFSQIHTEEVTVAIVFHSGYGHTARQAQAVSEGVAQAQGAVALLVSVEQAQNEWAALESADAIIFGAPTYMGSASAAFKAFMDASAGAFFKGAWKDKLAAGFTNSASRSGDKLATLTQFAIFAAQHGMHWISLGLPPGNNSSSGSEQDANRLGFFLGAAAQSNADEGVDLAPPQSDLDTARYLGQRVAQAALQFTRGRTALRELEA
ncbi:flavodoxin family protein [Paraburkholderia azotifigens]|uniref:flavodoxin family protein n=1 Tax=Paraburkholderia azotifigens TaxID=2057004 RepID=UPI0031749642